ncbi:hypothetical protein PHYBOEH_007114 [Phytophthora boehmeriae]|uniref:TRUD domain-containing protein n=1 Tax=Phytophthora boehmeriae TaxID=109152 RepID=A0A8T1X2T8_9STRA|nr:hypothetical protein PHYBOEH_007114 [Phytophthora boehmeriae]
MKTSVGGAVVGIEEFVNNDAKRSVVHGRIKTAPEDFVVREIDSTGVVVDFSGDSERIPTESEREEVLKLIEAKQAQKVKREKLVFEDPVDGWRLALTELIGAGEANKVESVAKCQTDECFLVVPDEFRDRVYLQVCIQNCFPGLDCKMQNASTPEDKHEVQQIHVLLDPVYKKFRDGGMTLTNCDRLLLFLRKGASDAAASKGLELEHEDTKEARTVLHRLISKHSSSFKTKTETRNGVQRLVVHFLPKNNKKRKRSQPQVYLQFTLQKRNQEHFACFDKLAHRLKRPVSAFSYAGTKDKTAITFQHVVVSGVAPDRLLNINQAEGEAEDGVRVGDLKFVASPMSLGGAKGNRFTIVIRGLSCEEGYDAEMIRPTLESALEKVKIQGFANYFGFQRVGLPTSAVRSHHIGEKIIAGKYEDAVRLLLEPQEDDSKDAARAKQLYLESSDVEAAIKLMPLSHAVERQVLQGLKRYGCDAFEQAVKNVSFSRRVMYMHSYQSYLFNRMASFRLRHYGAKVVAGDLIHCDDQACPVKIVTAEEAETLNNERNDALALVRLPLPGTNVMLPSNATKEACFKVMEQGATKKALCESGPVKGAYRSLVSFPRDLEWAWEKDQDNAFALKLSFSLDSGCFATMCLREVLHSDI